MTNQPPSPPERVTTGTWLPLKAIIGRHVMWSHHNRHDPSAAPEYVANRILNEIEERGLVVPKHEHDRLRGELEYAENQSDLVQHQLNGLREVAGELVEALEACANIPIRSSLREVDNAVGKARAALARAREEGLDRG